MRQLLKYLLLLSSLLQSGVAFTQGSQFQQELDYRIDVSLDEKSHLLKGLLYLQYKNNSPDSLTFIWFQLWPNAFKNDRTAFSEQLLELNRTDFYFSTEEKKGYINRLAFRVNGKLAETRDHPEQQDIIQVLLPEPLAPGAMVDIETPFQVKLPFLFSRSGHRNSFHAISNWYPKPAVYDSAGWHPMPYLQQGGDYASAANFDVRIHCSDKIMIAAAGTETDRGEEENSYHFLLKGASDFAWFAAEKFQQTEDSLILPSGKLVVLNKFSEVKSTNYSGKLLPYAKAALLQYSKLIGEYPYERFTIVTGNRGEEIIASSFPSITFIQDAESETLLQELIWREVLHAGWSVTNNKEDHPWMDNGLAAYYQYRFVKPGLTNLSNQPRHKSITAVTAEKALATVISMRLDQPVETNASSFNKANYRLISHQKAADWFLSLERELGKPMFDSCLKKYFETIKAGQDEGPQHLRLVFESVSGQQINRFNQLKTTGALDSTGKSTITPVFLFDRKGTAAGKIVGIGPAPGYNRYDGFMIGAFVHNYQLPLPRFRFFIAPMYGTRSKILTGIADLNYTGFLSGYRHQWKIGIQAARFSGYASTTEEKTIFLPFDKLAPYIKWQLKEPDARAKRERTIQFKSFFFRETEIDYSTSLPAKKTTSRNLQQIFLRWADHRILYPYDYNLQVDYQSDFTRLAFEGNYFFNYAQKGKGLKLRFFAGKFIYNKGKTGSNEFELDRYQLNMTGANGYEDYTYSDYFFGRNEFMGWQSQQIMKRDGGFKVRTDQLNRKIGKSDDWLLAINLNTDLPDRINPLSLLPFRLPLKIFADIGTAAEAWEQDYEGQRLLFAAGLQLSFFHEFVNIYIPIVNSKPFREYNHSVLGEKRFWKTLSFSVDFQAFRARPWLAKAGL